jgi:hypothetical protein
MAEVVVGMEEESISARRSETLSLQTFAIVNIVIEGYTDLPSQIFRQLLPRIVIDL